MQQGEVYASAVGYQLGKGVRLLRPASSAWARASLPDCGTKGAALTSSDDAMPPTTKVGLGAGLVAAELAPGTNTLALTEIEETAFACWASLTDI